MKFRSATLGVLALFALLTIFCSRTPSMSEGPELNLQYLGSNSIGYYYIVKGICDSRGNLFYVIHSTAAVNAVTTATFPQGCASPAPAK